MHHFEDITVLHNLHQTTRFNIVWVLTSHELLIPIISDLKRSREHKIIAIVHLGFHPHFYDFFIPKLAAANQHRVFRFGEIGKSSETL
jgi:hypothetical protein